MEEKQLYSEPLPYDIDDVVYYMEKFQRLAVIPALNLLNAMFTDIIISVTDGN